MTTVINNALIASKSSQKFRQQFSNEISVFNAEDIAVSTYPSIQFFTAAKCASTYVQDTIAQPLARAMGLVPIRIAPLDTIGSSANTFGCNNPDFLSCTFLQNVERLHSYTWAQSGYLFGIYRFFESKYLMQNTLKILLVRDIRDALTSHYFSMKYSHPLSVHNEQQRNFILNLRKKAHEMSIDEYVLECAPRYRALYERYAKYLLGKQNVCCVTYEELVTDTTAWMQRIVTDLQLPVSSSDIHSIVNKTDFSIDKENAHSHKRQVLPGDHLRKLQPETICKLDTELGDILKVFQYSVSA